MDRCCCLPVCSCRALFAVTFSITGALPGISHGRALTVNLAGSLVANTLPFGGALAVGATYAMCRSWGFSRAAIGISILLGGIFATAAKVLLPMVGLAALILQGGHISPALRNAALFGVLTLVALLAVFVTVMISSRAAHVVGLAVQRVAETTAAAAAAPPGTRLGTGHHRAAGSDQGGHADRLAIDDVRHPGLLRHLLRPVHGVPADLRVW